jgi:hypothetical protein
MTTKFFVAIALFASWSWTVAAADSALVARLRAECLKNFVKETPAQAKSWCDCIMRHHGKYTSNEDLKILIDVYAGSEKYNKPGIPEGISILLNNDADIVEKCEAKPNWNVK